ncbi:MAG: T9SS type A sorting domain-containing protein [Olleya sp.]
MQVKSLHLIVCLLTVSFCLSQTKIAELNFETPGGYTTNITEFTDNGRDYFLRTDGTDFNHGTNGVLFNNLQGGFYFAAQDTDGEGAPLPARLFIENIDISNYTNLEFRVHLAEDDQTTNGGTRTEHWDNGDNVRFTYEIDNSGTNSNLLWIENDNVGANRTPLIDTDFDGIGDGVAITDTFTQHTRPITGTGNLLDISIRIRLNGNHEDIAIDNIEIWGTQNCTSTVTWDGTNWLPTTPNRSTTAILASNYNTSTVGQPSFTACSLVINPGVNLTVSSNEYVQIITDVTNNGRIAIQNTGSFVQVDNSATYDDTGSSFFTTDNAAVVERNTSFINQWYEYTYWSSPVANETFGNALFQSSQYRRFEFNAANFVDSQYETNNDNTLVNGSGVDDIDDNGDVWFLKGSSDLMTPGVGYTATHSQDAFIFGAGSYSYSFRGTLNNGNITVPVQRNDTETNDTNWNLIGNPYPSAIDVDLFFAENNYLSNPTNGKLDGELYLWSHATAPDGTANGNQALNFSFSDYARINGTAELAGGDGITPTRHIPSGQGFFVTYSDNPTSTTGTVTFNNAMRVTNNNTQFFRASNTNSATATITNNKLWLNMTTDTGLFNQTVIGYVPGATAANDGAYYDAKKNGATIADFSFYSVLPSDSKKLAIQGKSPSDLDLNETINLGFFNNINTPTIYTISINQFQGEFLSNNTIYLKDNLINTYQDLNAGDYSFTTEAGEFNNRFEIVFNQPSLSVNETLITSENLIIYEDQDDTVTFSLNNKDLTIKSIKIYDMLGRLLYNLKGENNTETYNLTNLNPTAYIAQIELSNGTILSKKALKK